MAERKDETPVITSFLTSIFQIIFMAMIYALFSSTTTFPMNFWIVVFFVSLLASAGIYYITTKAMGAVILYSFAMPTILVLLTTYFGSLIGISLTTTELGLLVMMTLISSSISSWLATNIAGKFESSVGFLSIVEKKKRRTIREED